MGGQISSQQRAANGEVISVNSLDHWNTQLKSSITSNKLMVIDFSADWCGPCKIIEPAVHDFAVEFSNVEFIKIDVDELPDVAKDYSVQAMPTFLLLKKGEEVGRVVGAKKDELRRMIEKHRY
ncbi:thioredoxin H2-like isoform X2 [Cynara cardunculus var. scolymus]|nr:thioredoxin H2-like isoform X2 [Cynara cardunculus var. scolymus]